ncbi:peptidase S8 [Croceicoccus ponticola]|uniref:Peptidase S8 n=2 Tax=Croceicoccus ponticola TaxID=2217664 RepID=A0A437GXY8_9SPHN|nr:peptidase S8 [Croceicoccus ponticola]
MAVLAVTALPATAQLRLPPIGVPPLGNVTDAVGDTVQDATADATRVAGHLLQIRDNRIAKLLRSHPDSIERDSNGDPARRGELFLLDAPPEALAIARQAGFVVRDTEKIEGLDIELVRLIVPRSLSLADAEEALRDLLPDATVSADNLHFPAGGAAASAIPVMLAASATSIRSAVGMIDGAPGNHVRPSSIRGFVEGAPYPSNHGSAIASLLRYAGIKDFRVADVYGTDPAGGNALAIAKALGWLTQGGAKVISISLVGPRNALLEKAVASAQRQGVIIVAAVGNDGPAAPPAYPASYNDVLAVTAVDGRNRALLEVGKARHLDYAAPGANLRVRNAEGERTRVRGTSFAVPLVAARAAAHTGSRSQIVAQLDKEAVDLGKKGADDTYGRGLLCGDCRP